MRQQKITGIWPAKSTRGQHARELERLAKIKARWERLAAKATERFGGITETSREEGMAGFKLTPPPRRKPRRKPTDETVKILTAAAKRAAQGAKGKRLARLAKECWPRLSETKAKAKLARIKNQHRGIYDALVKKFTPSQ